MERDNIDTRQARLDKMIAEFHAARRRRLVKYGIALWNRTEAAQREQLTAQVEPPPTKPS
jgi:hypothetical protein